MSTLLALLTAAVAAQDPSWHTREFAVDDRSMTTYDAARRRVVCASSIDTFPAGASTEVWEWDGAAWHQAHSRVTPTARWSGAFGYDSARARCVLFGGGSDLAQTWERAGTEWILRTPAQSPPGRSRARVAYDDARGRLVLFGGAQWINSNYVYLADTWEWDGTQWHQVTPPNSPAPRADHAMNDPNRQRVLLFGGGDTARLTALGDTWEWNGVAWMQRASGNNPPARLWHAMALDVRRQRVVLFGGSTNQARLADTWEWDGATWNQIPATMAPTARALHFMAYDPVRQRVLLHGGLTGNGSASTETWEWDGASWSQLTSALVPPPRAEAVMATDFTRGLVVLASGFPVGGGAALGDTWEWNGRGWRPATKNVPAPDRPTFGLSHDPVRRCTITDPYLGQASLRLDLSAVPPLGLCAFGVAAARRDLTFGGCAFVLDQPMLLATSADVTGFASLTLAVPRLPSLRGRFAYAQALALDSGTGLGVVLSPGYGLTFGD